MMKSWKKKLENKSFFTLGSIYSTDASEPRKCPKTKIQIKLNRVKNINWSEVGDLNFEPQNCKSGSLTTWPCYLFNELYLEG